MSENHLVRGDEVVPLTPTAVAVLQCLIERPGVTVSRQELLDRVWPGLNVTPDLVREYVFHLRTALNDDAKAPRYIETVRGKGFRLLGGVEVSEPDLVEPPQTPQPVLAPTPVHDMATAPNLSSTEDKLYRTATALHCAFDGAFFPSDRGATEAAYDELGALFRRAQTVIARHDGMIIRYLEDGFLALFGAPRAHEDHARRAAHAALELGDTTGGDGASADRAGTKQQISIGLSTGPIVVGTLEAPDGSRTTTAQGRAIAVARKLQARASAGTILICEATFQALKAEVTTDTTEDGHDGTQSHILLDFNRPRAGVPTSPVGDGARLVGRKEELAILHERYNRSREGDPQIVSLTGPPGIGKSRLFQELLQSLPAQEPAPLVGFCLPHNQATPLMPLIHVVQTLCGIAKDDNLADAKQKIHAHLSRLKLDASLRPDILGILGLQDEAHSRLGPQARRARAFHALDALILAAARERPVVLAFEDIHWIDASSAEWLSAFVAGLGKAAILLLVTYRSAAQSPEWIADGGATQLLLPPLASQDSDALARAVLAQEHANRNALAAGIAEKSQGNPFFIIELVSAANERPDGAVDALLPDSVQAVIATRIDRLEQVEKSVVRICSVLGGQINEALLKAVCGIDAGLVDRSLVTLQQQGFLRRSMIGSETNYRFKHALIEDTVYQSTALSYRAHLHQRVAAAMEQDFPLLAAAQPEALGRHLENAGDIACALPFWQRAARLAYERFANIEAISYAKHGLALLEMIEEPQHLAETELDLILTLAPALVATRGYGTRDLEPLYARARLLCSDNKRAQERFRALVGIWNFHWVRGELDDAHETASILLCDSESDGAPKNALRAHAAMGEILFHMGELEGSLKHLNVGIEVYDSASNHSMSTHVPQVGCLCYAAWALWHRGEVRQSRVRAEEATRLAQTLSHPLSLALATSLIAELHQYRLEYEECAALAEQAVIVSQEQRFPFWEGTAKVVLGWALAKDDFDHGRRMMLAGIDIFAGTGARIQRPTWLGMLAEVHHSAGHYDQGLAQVDQALGWAATTGEQHYLSELHRIKGDLLFGSGGPDALHAAEQAYRSAIGIARKQSAAMRELRAATSLAQMLCDHGQESAALDLLTERKGLFTSDVDCADLLRASELCQRLIH